MLVWCLIWTTFQMICRVAAPDLDGRGLGPRRGRRLLESSGTGWSMKSLVFPHIINIYYVILWRHICYLNCNKTLWCNAVFEKDYQFVKLLQNQSLQASHLHFFHICLKKVLKMFWKNFLGGPKFSSYLNAIPRSAINVTTKTKLCRQRRLPILFALNGLTG